MILQGGPGTRVTELLEVRISRCVNRVTCKASDEIDTFLKNHYFLSVSKYDVIDYENLEMPIQVGYNAIITGLLPLTG